MVFKGPPSLTIIYLCGLFFVGVPLFAQGSAQTTMFAQGKLRLGLSAGYGSWNSKDYGILGLGAGYYLVDGLEAGIDGEAWLGSRPHLYSVSPEVRYTFYQLEQFKPYIGGFYKRSLYDTFSPLDSAGARAGLVSPISEHAFLSAGIVTEHYFHCRSSVYGTCSQTYPEIGFGLVY